MKTCMPILLVLMVGLMAAPAAAPLDVPAMPEPDGAARFATLDILIDPGQAALGAYQFELTTTAGSARIAGIEGGEHPAFATPPYYDPAALYGGRVIIAAFSTAAELPQEQLRVATIHMHIEGAVRPTYLTELIVAADADGNAIPARLTLRQGEER